MDEEAGLVYFLTHVDTDIIQHSLGTILLELSNTKNPTNSGNIYSIDLIMIYLYLKFPKFQKTLLPFNVGLQGLILKLYLKGSDQTASFLENAHLSHLSQSEM